MADEYIRRDDAIEEINKWLDSVGTALVGKGMSYYGELIGCIKDTPAADVAPVRHGRWIEQEKYTFGVMYDCSICDNLILDNGHSWNYCPNCGARMDGGNEGLNENFEKIKGRLGDAEVLAQLAEECAELAQAALKLRRALDGKNPTQNTEEERRRALLEEYTDVVHCALVLDLEMDLDQIRKKTERWMRRLGIGEEDGN